MRGRVLLLTIALIALMALVTPVSPRADDAPLEPDAAARYAQARLFRGESTQAAADIEQLWAAGYRRAGYSGWGLTYAWDAFGDGSTNPADTFYSYTTASVAAAFLDAYDTLGERRYLLMAQEAGRTLAGPIGYLDNADGSITFRYSDQQPDVSYRVPNVSALAAAIFARLFAATREPAYESFARRAYAGLLAQQRQNGNWRYWLESPPRQTRENTDPLHWALIASSLYRGCEALAEPVYCKSAELAKEGIKRVHFAADGRFLGPYSKSGWDAYEPTLTLLLAGDLLASKAVAELDLPVSSDPQARPRAHSWYEYVRAFAGHVQGGAATSPPL